MTSTAHTFFYGQHKIPFVLIRKKRKTMEISVHPDASLIVKAPLDADMSVIENTLKKRGRWILKQQRYFEQFHPRMPQRYYLSGETHLYLGRKYQLKVITDNIREVQLKNGTFIVRTNDKSQSLVCALMQQWYREKAKEQFQYSLERCWKGEFEKKYDQPKIQVKKMKKRWGSLSGGGILTLNIELIKAPKECIDYVITHELCHLKYEKHDKAFFQLLEQRYPNWKTIKHKLEVMMS
jgi:hypothetical protein